MIDFAHGDDTRLLLDMVERFGREQLVPHLRQAEAERAVAGAVREQYERLGLMNLEAPAEGIGMTARVAVNELLGRADPGAALALDRLGAAAYALHATDQHERLDALLADPARRAWLVTPEDGTLNVSERIASGEVHFAPAGVTDLFVLSPIGIAEVHEGFSEVPVRGAGLRAADPVRIQLDDAPVARFHRVATAPVLARARLYVASLLLGVLEASSTYARGYARERVAFGRPIAHHQGLTFLLMDMNTAVTGGRLLLQEAAWRFDARPEAEPDNHEAAAAAFAEVVEQSAVVGPSGVQVLGGLGFMQDYPVEKYMREARALGLLYGGADRARDDALSGRATALMAGGLV